MPPAAIRVLGVSVSAVLPRMGAMEKAITLLQKWSHHHAKGPFQPQESVILGSAGPKAP
jgi:hypothetical protein